MEWVSDDNNDALLRKYMELLWSDNEWEAEAKPLEWSDFKIQLKKGIPGERPAKLISLPLGENNYKRLWHSAASAVILIVAGLASYTFLSPNGQRLHAAYRQAQKVTRYD